MCKTMLSTVFIILTMTRMVFGEDAQTTPPVEPKAICEKALGLLAEDKVSDMAAVLQASGGFTTGDADWKYRVLPHLENWHRTNKYALGEPLGWEFVREYRVNETLRRYVYLFKYDSGVACWMFDFYRRRDDWKLTSLKYDTNLDPLWLSSSSGQPQSPDCALTPRDGKNTR
jgi:hypothetical protein